MFLIRAVFQLLHPDKYSHLNKVKGSPVDYGGSIPQDHSRTQFPFFLVPAHTLECCAYPVVVAVHHHHAPLYCMWEVGEEKCRGSSFLIRKGIKASCIHSLLNWTLTERSTKGFLTSIMLKAHWNWIDLCLTFNSLSYDSYYSTTLDPFLYFSVL